MKIKTPDEAKAAAERLAELKEYAKEAYQLEKALKEYIEDPSKFWSAAQLRESHTYTEDNIEIYHNGKTIRVGWWPPKRKHADDDIRDACAFPKKNNKALYMLLLKHGVKPDSAWRCFKAVKKEIESAVKAINTTEFTREITELASFDDKPRFGFRVIGEDE